MTLRVRLHIRFGNDPQVDAETLMISRFGAKLRIGPSHQRLVSGDQIRLCKRGSYNWCSARVVWIDRIASSSYGIELQTTDNFWAVYFPELANPNGQTIEMKTGTGYSPIARRSPTFPVPPPTSSLLS